MEIDNRKSGVITALKHWFSPLYDVLFIKDCYHCQGPLTELEERICTDCWSSLSVVRQGDHTLSILQNRFAEGGVVDGVEPLWYFEKKGVLQSLVHALKYEDMSEFGFILGQRLAEKVRDCGADAVVPVPLNRKKLRERGYNQSDWIARGIGDRTGLPVLSSAVARVKYTVTQTHLNADQRRENIAEAFAVIDPPSVKARTILIVDDIITTGSTIQEVAKVLKNAGAVKVIVASPGLARLGEDG